MTDRSSRLLVAAFAFALGCNWGPTAETRRDCDSAKRWLDLEAGDVTRCLKDAAFREQLRPQVDERFAAQLVAGHNRERAIMRLRGVKPPGFTRLAKPSALPVQMLGLDEKDEKHIGERYIVRAKVAWSPSDDPNFSPSIFLHSVENSGDETTMVGTDALDQYQRSFLATYCWMGGPPSTLCAGDVYLEIRKDVRGLFVVAEAVGADFAEADAKAVLAYFTDLHSAAARSPRSRAR